MTLMEMSVALAILGLAAGLAFSNLGPWLAQARRGGEEAAFWRAAAPARLTLMELTSAAVRHDGKRPVVTARNVSFLIYAPRLSPGLAQAELTIAETDGAYALTARLSGTDESSVLLQQAPPLRFDAANADALVLEARIREEWRPLVIAPFAADAPLVCQFDLIARACR